MSTLDTMASEQLDTHLAQLEDRLGKDYANVAHNRLHAMVARERARFAGARIHAFVPILIERTVRAALTTP
ncbi:three-helix bundle dimerization domain-containing protein [Amycolatopsis sp. NPDC003731]